MINIKAWFGLEYYVSPLGQFLKEFDHTHPHLSTSQQEEIAKYKRIHAMRDKPNYDDPQEKPWDSF
jgi:hypothetical protein